MFRQLFQALRPQDHTHWRCEVSVHKTDLEGVAYDGQHTTRVLDPD